MPRAFLAWLAAAAVFAVIWLLPSRAAAYPFMIRHEYTSCSPCHTDPSGGGLLTPYGRAQAAVLLSSGLGLPKDEEEPGKYKDFLFGAFPMPEFLDAQAWERSAYIVNMSGGKVVDNRYLLMRADAAAHVHAGPFRASGTLGVASADSKGFTEQAWVTHNQDGVNLVAREYWLGFALAEDAVLVRAGRINMPFGVRQIEHTMWTRARTQTDTNQQQQGGVAVSYTGEKIRGEILGVLGNPQVSPDAYRDRGYSAYAEYALDLKYTLGVSSTVLHAEADPATRRPYFRQAHGLFSRMSPVKPLALLVEGDLLVESFKLDNPAVDFTGMVQADFEAWKGIHFMGTGEMLTASRSHATLVGGWLSAWVFLFAHMDARVDLIERTAASGPATTTALFQLHGWL